MRNYIYDTINDIYILISDSYVGLYEAKKLGWKL